MPLAPTPRQLTLIRISLFLLCLSPLGRLLWGVWQDDLGPNPVEFVQRWTGSWTFNFLLLTLCISPLRGLTQWHWLLRFRRMLGLYSFFYATLHFLAFIGFDHAFDPIAISQDILKRPFVTIGFAAFALLIPLAATSNAFAIRRLGGRRWQELHRTVYLIGILACVHYFWLVKATALLWPIAYTGLLALLLAWRVRERRRKAIPVPRPASVSPLRFHARKPE